CLQTKTGIYLMQEGNEEPFNIRLHLARDILTIQEQDVICLSGEPFYSSERTVTIRRQTIGGFGLSIKGGAEHKIPVVISKISKEQKGRFDFTLLSQHIGPPRRLLSLLFPAELSGLLFIGDGILQINGINVRSYRHEEVVQVLRNAGEEVTLTVSFLKKTPAFLKLPLCEDCTCIPSDQSSGTSSPLCDSGLHLNYHPNNTQCQRQRVVSMQLSLHDRNQDPPPHAEERDSAPLGRQGQQQRAAIERSSNLSLPRQDTLSCSSWPTSPALRWEKRWVDLRLIPLLHSRLSRYSPGSDSCRWGDVRSGLRLRGWALPKGLEGSEAELWNGLPVEITKNAFQVIAMDGVCSGVVQFATAEDCLDWLQAISSNISSLTKHNVKKINRNFPVNQQIIYMGWADEKEQDSVQDRMYSPKFLALRGSSLFKFSAPPVTTWDWTRAEKSFTVYEIMFKILKDNDLLDKRKHCFSVQTESGEDMFFSVELDCELLIWEKAFQTATFLEVERIQCKTYACIMESHLMGLTVDFTMGFVCFDAASKAVLWRYKFSQLKGSSDDGKSKIKFLFQNQDSKSIEAKVANSAWQSHWGDCCLAPALILLLLQELEFSNLFAVLHCIHAFFAAKVACLDPMFVESQGTATTA
ncbi:unnamed protein product, partial [Tetraodon nigroviridis]